MVLLLLRRWGVLWRSPGVRLAVRRLLRVASRPRLLLLLRRRRAVLPSSSVRGLSSVALVRLLLIVLRRRLTVRSVSSVALLLLVVLLLVLLALSLRVSVLFAEELIVELDRRGELSLHLVEDV